MPKVEGHTLRFQIEPFEPSESHGSADRRIRLFVDGAVEPAAEEIGKLSFEGPTKAALAAIQEGNASEKQVLEGGSALWERLRTGTIGAALEPLREEGGKLHLYLALRSADELLPWEALVDVVSRKRLAATYDYVLIRHPERELRATRARARPLSLLTVVPGRTRLRVDKEMADIRRAFEDHGVAVEYGDPLCERVTVDTLRDCLAHKIAKDGTPYEIIHFIGHGLIGTDGVPKLQLNDDGSGEHELPPSSLASLLEGNPPRLVVLNACSSGSGTEVKGLAGFGQELLGAGVQAVVAMQHAIEDKLASSFAREFYRKLAQSGRADAAVTAGRQYLLQKQTADTAMTFSIPVLFEAPGVEPLFDLSAGPRVEAAAESPAAEPAEPRVSVPPLLMEAVSEGWCIPVLGPSLSSPSRGSTGPAWTPGTLAAALAKKCQFPEQTIVTAMSQFGERIDHMVLQRVCQHFEEVLKRHPLTSEVKKCLSSMRTIPKLHENLSSWHVPGFVCSHFDGLLTEAFESCGFRCREINSPDQHASAADPDPLIVHMRGSIRDERSLCLTGEDHDRLLDAMTRMDATNSAVSGLVAARDGMCLLLLGVTAWDPWLRHLLWRMVPRDSYTRNTLYIVQPHPTAADKAAWGGFEVEWIPETPEDVVAAITKRVASSTEARK